MALKNIERDIHRDQAKRQVVKIKHIHKEAGADGICYLVPILRFYKEKKFQLVDSDFIWIHREWKELLWKQ